MLFFSKARFEEKFLLSVKLSFQIMMNSLISL